MTRLSQRPWLAQALLDTPLGPVRVAATAQGLGGLWFEGQAHHPGPLAAPLAPDQAWLRQAALALQAYWSAPQGALPELPLDLGGTPFQQAVWQQLRRIPAGQTCSYSALAAAIGRPAAVRAVGAAVGRNPVSVLVPCHRVLGHDGALTGYAGGLPRKQALLAAEAAGAARAGR